MTNKQFPTQDPGKTHFLRGAMLATATVIVFMGLTFYAAKVFIAEEKQHQIQAWQVRLGIIVDGRKNAIENWVNGNFSIIEDLSKNLSLQLYMTQIALAEQEKGAEAHISAEVAFLRNLILAKSLSHGFSSVQKDAIQANFKAPSSGGIAIFRKDGRILVATPSFDRTLPQIGKALKNAAQNGEAFIDLFRNDLGGQSLGLVVPVNAVQNDLNGDNHLGYIVAIRQVGKDLFSHLNQPGDTTKTGESYLVRNKGNVVQYISPLNDGTNPLELELSVDTPDLAAVSSLKSPGLFRIQNNYKGVESLTVSRKIDRTPWVLIRSTSRAEALAQADQRFQNSLFGIVGLTLLIGAAFLIAWRHGSSVRAKMESSRYRQAAERAINAAKFGRILADSQQEKISVVDYEGRYTFANKRVVEGLGLKTKDVVGKSMASIIGPINAAKLAQTNNQVFQTKEPKSAIYTLTDNDQAQIVSVDHVPLAGDLDYPPGVLMVMNDITELMKGRREREETLRQVVQTLVKLVGKKDPYSTYHSAKVAKVANCIAVEMDLEEDIIRTIDLTGNLINVGRITVSNSLLNKKGPLQPEERKTLHDAMFKSAELLEEINFDLPVIETLRQIGEHWDGTGEPNGLKGEEILITARILAVAHAFVGMVSDRAYRPPCEFGEAYDYLNAEAGKQFERAPIAALINYMEVKGGRERWAYFRTPIDNPAEKMD